NIFLPDGFSANQTQGMDDVQADEKFLEVMGFELIAGRNFSKEFSTDKMDAAIVNETAVKSFGWGDPVGKQIKMYKPGYDGMHPSTVIGVIKDVHFRPIGQMIEPLVISNNTDNLFNPASLLSIRIRPENVESTVSYISDVWKSMHPDTPFNYSFLDESFDRQFNNFSRTMDIFSNFTIIAIFIACLGLFGMASYTTEQRTKEIGIRKVLGASAAKIVLILNIHTLKLAVLSNIVAWPVVYFLMDDWFRSFPYRISISITTFAAAALLIGVIGFVSVAFQSFKAAMANPVKSLRFE
ncbi:ABC transporter permease, partial [candidate division KSB1 bacterium]